MQEKIRKDLLTSTGEVNIPLLKGLAPILEEGFVRKILSDRPAMQSRLNSSFIKKIGKFVL
jgi:hypothetical protein